MLNKSIVQFNQENHTYHIGDVVLSGVTALLSRTIFKDKYDGVPEFILRRAAEKGSLVHEHCEMVDELGVASDMVEARNYLRLCEENGLRCVASEYLISDNMRYASSIDKVFWDGGVYHLGDIKTTSKLDLDYVRWQLSIYAYLFELQNEDAKVGRLLAIYLRDNEARLVEVDRIGADIVKKLFKADAEGKEFVDPFAKSDITMPAVYRQIENKMEEILIQYDECAKALEEMKEGLMKEMVAAGVYSWRGEKVSITRRKENITKRFDSKAFQKDYPELYRQYMKDASTKGSITIKING